MRIYKFLPFVVLTVIIGFSCKKSQIDQPDYFNVMGVEYKVYDYYYLYRTADSTTTINYTTEEELIENGKFDILKFDSAMTYSFQNGGSGTWFQNGSTITTTSGNIIEDYTLEGNKLRYSRGGYDAGGNYFFERILFSVIREFDGTIDNTNNGSNNDTTSNTTPEDTTNTTPVIPDTTNNSNDTTTSNPLLDLPDGVDTTGFGSMLDSLSVFDNLLQQD